MITRKLNWIESVNPANRDKIKLLEDQLSDFYSHNQNYYGEINFTSDNWINQDEAGYQHIVEASREAGKICEVGCGSANILKHHSYLESKYSGCDFSDGLMTRNKGLYPGAEFVAIEKPNFLPFADQKFDLVFSVFVIEHSTNPSLLLNECSRILKPGGKLVILCPDFLGTGRMTSQRAGLSAGTASQKLKKGRIIDALITLYDNRIRIPSNVRKLIKKASSSPLFLVNLSPVVFEDKFSPDVDAVYVTFKKEIINYLDDSYSIEMNSGAVSEYERNRNLIYISLIKKPN